MPMPAKPIAMAAGQGGAPGTSAAPQSWGELAEAADAAPRSQKTGNFGSQSASSGSRTVTIVEGEVSAPVPDPKLVAKGRQAHPALAGEHATHAVGAQLGENLPEALTSGPASALNLSLLKKVENATRATFDAATEVGATVETRTTLNIERRVVGGQEDHVLVGVRRQASVRALGANKSIDFIDYEVSVDPATRQVTELRNLVLRPPPTP